MKTVTTPVHYLFASNRKLVVDGLSDLEVKEAYEKMLKTLSEEYVHLCEEQASEKDYSTKLEIGYRIKKVEEALIAAGCKITE